MSIRYLASTAQAPTILAVVRALVQKEGRSVTSVEIMTQIARDWCDGHNVSSAVFYRKLDGLLYEKLLEFGSNVVIGGRVVQTYQLSQTGRESLEGYIKRLIGSQN